MSWGCGTNCNSYVEVNAKTGKVIHPRHLQMVNNLHVDVDELCRENIFRYRRDSCLPVVTGKINNQTNTRDF